MMRHDLLLGCVPGIEYDGKARRHQAGLFVLRVQVRSVGLAAPSYSKTAAI
jgi:hypothetical protein